MNNDQFPNFTNALKAYGSTDAERAKSLGIPLRSYMDIKAKRFHVQVRRVLRPDLLLALAADAEAHQQPSGVGEANASSTN